MDDVEITFTGLDELQQALTDLPRKVAEKGLRVSLKAGAAPIEAAMVTLAPKNTGFLAEHFSTKIKMAHDQLSASAFIGPKGKVDYPMYLSGAYKIIRNAKGKAIKIGKVAVATIARFLEFGTSKMSKKPFMTQAFESNKEAALGLIIQGLATAVGQAADASPKGPPLPSQ